MELLERYLYAISRYLPEDTKADTIAELRANLLEQMDARAEELDHPLSDADVAAVLKAHGKPEQVALRYLPQQSLIGPTVFPFYMLTLKRGLPFVVLISALAQALAFVTASRMSLQDALFGLVQTVAYSVFLSTAWITLGFAAFEWAARTGRLNATKEFDPAKLSPVPHEAQRSENEPSQKSRAKRIIALVAHCLLLAWVISLPFKLAWHIGRGTIGIDLSPMGLQFAPVWHVFYGLMVAALALQVLAKIVTLRTGEPRWIDLATDPLGILGFAWLAMHSEFFIAASSATNLNDLTAANAGLAIAVRVLLVFSVFGLLRKGWRYLRLRQNPTLLAF